MNRRAFLSALVAGAAGLALDPERLLWVPGAKTIFLPPTKPTLVSSCALTRGDIFTIGGVFEVNPITGLTTDFLQSFVVTADVSSGDVALTDIVPRPIDSGPYRNVNRFGGCNQIQPLHTGPVLPFAATWVDG